MGFEWKRFEWNDEMLKVLISLLMFDEITGVKGVEVKTESRENGFCRKEIKRIGKTNRWKTERVFSEGERFILFSWGRKVLIIDKIWKLVFLFQRWNFSPPWPAIYIIPPLSEEEQIRFIAETTWKAAILKGKENEYRVSEDEMKKLMREINIDLTIL